MVAPCVPPAGSAQVRVTVPSGLAVAVGVVGLAGTVTEGAWLDGADVGPVPKRSWR